MMLLAFESSQLRGAVRVFTFFSRGVCNSGRAWTGFYCLAANPNFQAADPLLLSKSLSMSHFRVYAVEGASMRTGARGKENTVGFIKCMTCKNLP